MIDEQQTGGQYINLIHINLFNYKKSKVWDLLWHKNGSVTNKQAYFYLPVIPPQNQRWNIMEPVEEFDPKLFIIY